MIKKFLSIALSLLILTAALPVGAQYLAPNGDEKVTFIVEVEGDPLAISAGLDGTAAVAQAEDDILHRQASVMSYIQDEISADAQIGYVYTALFNGFSFDGERSQREEIASLPRVKNVYISGVSYLPEPMMNAAGELTDTAYSYGLGYDGKGQVIAILDAGCDTGHDFFSEAPANPKYTRDDIDTILKSNTLNSGTASANQVYKSEKIPYAFNYTTGTADTYYQTMSHGTHVAGIAAGKNGTSPDGSGTFSGVAPEAQLLILSCGTESGSFTDAAVFAALNDAALLGADIINMSFGMDYADTSLDAAYMKNIRNAKAAGISLIAANGNSSRGFEDEIPLTANPDYAAAGTPNGFSEVTAVASADNVSKVSEYWSMQHVGGAEIKLYSPFASSAFTSLFSEGSYLEYADCGYGLASDFTGLDLTGKLALIRRGENTFVEKADNAAAAGAVGIILINSTAEIITTTVMSLPTALAFPDTGAELAGYEDKRIGYSGIAKEAAAIPTAGKISYFSSWGVDSSLELKPEITAPGGSIYSAYPDNKYGYASGTSMASPHMAGITALAREYYALAPFADAYNGLTGKKRADLIENLAMNSAKIILQENSVPYSPRLQGAGMVNMEGITQSKVLLTGDSGKAKVSLGEVSGNTLDIAFQITNITDTALTFDDISFEVLADGYEQIEGEYYVNDTVRFAATAKTEESITVEAGNTYDFSATVTLDEEMLAEYEEIFPNGFFIDGFVSLSGSDCRASLPFTAFRGDWQAAPIYDTTLYEEGGSSLVSDDANGTYLAQEVLNTSQILGRNLIDNDIIDGRFVSYASKAGYPLEFNFTNYRGTDGQIFEILDENKETVYKKVLSSGAHKFYSYYYQFPLEETAVLEDGSYTFTAKAIGIGADLPSDTLQIPLVIDNTMPQFLAASFDSEAKTVRITARDNHYLSALYVVYTNDEGKQVPLSAVVDNDADLTDGCATKTIDVSEVTDTDSMIVGCMDYALNETYMPLSYYADTVGAELSSLNRLEGMTAVKFTLRNNTDAPLNANVIVAFYDESGRVMASGIKKISQESSEEESVSFSMLTDTGSAAALKLFIWDGETLQPLDGAKEFDISE